MQQAGRDICFCGYLCRSPDVRSPTLQHQDTFFLLSEGKIAHWLSSRHGSGRHAPATSTAAPVLISAGVPAECQVIEAPAYKYEIRNIGLLRDCRVCFTFRHIYMLWCICELKISGNRHSAGQSPSVLFTSVEVKDLEFFHWYHVSTLNQVPLSFFVPLTADSIYFFFLSKLENNFLLLQYCWCLKAWIFKRSLLWWRSCICIFFYLFLFCREMVDGEGGKKDHSQSKRNTEYWL